MRVLTAAQMREADRLTTERYGVPGLQLMENAGAAVVEFLQERIPGVAGCKVLVLCGKGNNGGDGLVIARLLQEAGASPQVILLAQPDAMRGDAAANLKRWQAIQGKVRVASTAAEWAVFRPVLDAADVVVDALLGTGLRGPAEGLYAVAIADLNTVRAGKGRRNLTVVAVDMPSGIAADGQDFGSCVVRADMTVTFTAPKIGQLVSARASCCGVLAVRAIGTPPDLLECDPALKIHWLEPREFRTLKLIRDSDSNKGTYGHALIVAGSLGKSGAAILAARAALRSGAGLVTVATPREVLPVVAAGMPELMTAALDSTESGSASLANLDYGRFAEISRGKSVMAIGPGLSTHTETQQFIRSVVGAAETPVILDADGLNAYAAASDELRNRRTRALAMTPHPGEMARVLGLAVPDVQARRMQVAMESASRWDCYVVLKGFHTILATPSGHAYINTTGNPGMATGGTGDVLTGLLAGLTAQHGTAEWERVLGLGIYLHGLAGDIAASRVGQAPLIASDVIDAIPEAYSRLLAELEHGA